MKKTIYDLNKQEGTKLDLEIRKTSYFKQYTLNFGISVIALIIIAWGSILWLEDMNAENIIPIVITITAGFLMFYCLIYEFKRFDLIKDYYEKKKDKKE